VTFTPHLAVPNLETMTLDAVNATLAGMPLTAVIVPPAPAAGTTVHDQDPQPETPVPANTKITVTFA
jgi:beta-lactam-binding protein with PASTA domain